MKKVAYEINNLLESFSEVSLIFGAFSDYIHCICVGVDII